eukprot:3940409-Rhodomonas_salina.3
MHTVSPIAVLPMHTVYPATVSPTHTRVPGCGRTYAQARYLLRTHTPGVVLTEAGPYRSSTGAVAVVCGSGERAGAGVGTAGQYCLRRSNIRQISTGHGIAMRRTDQNWVHGVATYARSVPDML